MMRALAAAAAALLARPFLAISSHRHPVSIIALRSLLFIAHGLFHCFMRNLKPRIRRGSPALFRADLMRAKFQRPVFSSA